MVAFETDLPIGFPGFTDAPSVDPIIDAFDKVMGITLDPIANPPSGDVVSRLNAGTIDYGLGLGGSGMPYAGIAGVGFGFGFDPDEYAAWFYEGGGKAIYDAELATASNLYYSFLVSPNPPEGGGWWKEPISSKIFDEGKYSTGEEIRVRFFGTMQALLNRVFPNVKTPAATPATSPLQDFKDGVFTAVEYGHPKQDAVGLFPSYPAVTDSIIASGAKHYYMTGWWTPVQTIELWVRKAVYDAFTADQKEQVNIICRNCTLTNLSHLQVGQGQIVQKFQELGATVHRTWPHDVLKRLNALIGEELDEQAAADGTGAYTAVLDSMKTYSQNERLRWSSGAVARADRFQWPGWESIVSL